MYLGRRWSFSMGHRLHQGALSEDVNRKLYGKCNNPNGHGHQYVLELTFAGSIDPDTGFSVDLTEVDRIVHTEILNRFDHRDFDRDFPEFADIVSSGENLARLFWGLLAPCFPSSAPLVRLRLEETEKNSFEYFGEQPMFAGARIYEAIF